MTESEILSRLALAFAIGFLVGIERGWGSRGESEGERTAGLRTFTLTGLFGGVSALLADKIGPVAYAAGFAAFAAAMILFRWRETQHENTFGATTLVAALLTFALGAYAVAGSMPAAAAAAVAVTGILAAKHWLHAFLRTLTWPELRATLILLAMSFVALPVLPNRGFGPQQALNPYELWVMAIAIAGVSFIGYLAIKIAGTRFGPLIAGVAGGLVSSTITTIDLARRAKAQPSTRRAQLAGALAASATMFARVTVIVAVFGPALLWRVAGPMAAAFALTVLAAVVIDPPWVARKGAEEDARDSHISNPFEFRTVLLFALVLAIVILISSTLTAQFGGGGGIVLAAIAGISDVDAITLSMTRLAGASITRGEAAIAVLVAVAANSVSKSVLAMGAGGPWFGFGYLSVSAGAIVVGAVAATFLVSP